MRESRAAIAANGTMYASRAPLIDLLELKESEFTGPSLFAVEDIPAGKIVLGELPVLEGPLRSEKVKALLSELALKSAVNVGSAWVPQQVTTLDVGMLDAFAAATSDVQEEILAMQYEVDAASPIAHSVKMSVQVLQDAKVFDSLDQVTMERVLLVARVNAHGFGSGRQALFSRGRLIAHSCQPNCIVVAEQCIGVNGDIEVYGYWRAIRDIQKGEMVTMSYMPEEFAAQKLEQRRHYVLCQKGFLCHCPLCREGSACVDRFDRLPCPTCRPRNNDGMLPGDQLIGCCATRAEGVWRSECGESFEAHVVQASSDDALIQEALLSVVDPPTENTTAVRNAMLAKVIQSLGEDHSASQLLLRTGALRAVANAQSLPSLSERVYRCHKFLVGADWPLGMMPIHGLYKAIIARAQAEIKAKTPTPLYWAELVTDAAHCARIVEGADAETAKVGKVVASLLLRMAPKPSSEDPLA